MFTAFYILQTEDTNTGSAFEMCVLCNFLIIKCTCILVAFTSFDLFVCLFKRFISVLPAKCDSDVMFYLPQSY